jgi:hypothetical protein
MLERMPYSRAHCSLNAIVGRKAIHQDATREVACDGRRDFAKTFVFSTD